MRAIRFTMAVILGAALLFALSACDREITRVEEVSPDANTCFQCHSDQDLELVAAELQWQNSVHASGLNTDRNSASCSGCHTGDGFLDRVRGESPQSHPNASVIHCFTCHAPHTNLDLSLRPAPTQVLENGVEYDLGSGNLCASCHQARRGVDSYVVGQVTLNTHWGPHHSVQADMLLGTNGYEYDGYDYQDLEAHRRADDACIKCHYDFTQNFVVGGHSFAMSATLEGEEIHNTGACVDCHGEGTTFAYADVQDSVATLAIQLETLLDQAGLWHDGHPVAGATTSADSAGALWNFLMVAIEDRSFGIHNPWYEIDLLQSSIMYLEGDLPQTQAEAVDPKVVQAPWAGAASYERR